MKSIYTSWKNFSTVILHETCVHIGNVQHYYDNDYYSKYDILKCYQRIKPCVDVRYMIPYANAR